MDMKEKVEELVRKRASPSFISWTEGEPGPRTWTPIPTIS